MRPRSSRRMSGATLSSPEGPTVAYRSGSGRSACAWTELAKHCRGAAQLCWLCGSLLNLFCHALRSVGRGMQTFCEVDARFLRVEGEVVARKQAVSVPALIKTP